MSVYSYQQPQYTYTLEQFAACTSTDTMSYHNLSFVDTHDGIKFDTYNVTTDYIDEIRDEYCVTVSLTDKELDKYKYRPKLLCYKIYGNGELAFLILLINDMCSVKEFTKKKLLMPKKQTMKNLVKYLYNANRAAIQTYNNKVTSTIDDD